MTQKERWKGAGGNAWVELQALMDQVMAGLVPPLVDGIHGAVLDVGCGTGATTVAAARTADRVVGVDISEPMVEAARQRDPSLEFVVADAQTHPFEGFDWVISRFGVMFFDDPVAAFANLRRAGERLRAIVWRRAEENPFMTTAERAARRLLPNLPPRDVDGPGQFAFGDPVKVRRLLEQAGWADVALERLDVDCAMPASALDTYLTRVGPVAMALQDADEDFKERVVEVVRPAFDPFIVGPEVRYRAACWMLSACKR
jgi:SAM-dependent methyltransferase